MRRLFFSLLALSFVGVMMGCHHIAGVCDCDPNEDPCSSRAPWVMQGNPAPTTAPVPVTNTSYNLEEAR